MPEGRQSNHWKLLGGGLALLVWASGAAGAELSLRSMAWESLGRWHVAAVHFPVALLLVAALLEFGRLLVGSRFASKAAIVAVVFGALGAVAATVTGWMYAEQHSFAGANAQVLDAHRWLGVGVGAVGVLAAAMGVLVRSREGGALLGAYRLVTILGAIVVGVAAHLGGTLVHGPDFLRVVPEEAGPIAAATPIVTVEQVRFPEDGRIDYATHVQPILAQYCYECHGAEIRRGALRLDIQSAAFRGGHSGPAIIAKEPDRSPLLRRVLGLDGGDRMPVGGDPLSEEHTKILRTWIEQGAQWVDSRGAQDDENRPHWAYLKPVRPNLPAVRDTYWPRNPVDHFVLAKLEQEKLSPSPEADRAVLIRRVSLDLTGLPPTPEEVRAFLADRSPNAYEKLVDHLLALPQYGERWARLWLDLARYADTNGYEKDRIRSMWPYRDWVIKALNADMPFDQFTIEQLAGDLLPNATEQQLVATGFHRNTMLNEEGGVDPEEYRFNAVVDRVNTTATVWLGTTLSCAQCHNHKSDPFSIQDYYRFFAFFNNTAPETDKRGGTDPADVSAKIELREPRYEELGWQIKALQAKLEAPSPELEEAERKWEEQVTGAPQGGGTEPAAGEAKPKLPERIAAVLKVAREERTEPQKKELTAYFRSIAPELKPIREKIARLRQEQMRHRATSLVMRELEEPRASFVHIRGAFNDLGDRVEADVPAVLNPMRPDMPRNRLGLARWLVDPENPLTARVTVNRIWEQYFGRGLVATSEDFGTQGELPSHPQLLDWLATELIRQQWSLKAIHRVIVTSATYRQSSRMAAAMVERDPANRLLARGPRFRLEAEMIRDQALRISGLLSLKMGGPSVFPDQPEGIWAFVYSGDQWVTSTGEDRYRRGIYTFWRRSAPYPSFVAFDAPSRETICTRRPRSNTPLQALTTLNDPVFVQSAAALARRIVREGGAAVSDRVRYGFRLCAVREPLPEEQSRLVALYNQQLSNYKKYGKAAEMLAAGGLAEPIPQGVDVADLAAWTVVSNVLLNLDETLTKE